MQKVEPLLKHPKDVTRWKRGVGEEADVGLCDCSSKILRHHDQLVVVYPNCCDLMDFSDFIDFCREHFVEFIESL